MTKPTLEVESGFSRLRIDLTYDGSDLSGWAKQPGLRTVQEEVETALSTITRSKAATIVAGRTDAGVHAKHQVLHVDLPADIDSENLAFRLNQILKSDIRILSAMKAPEYFHARFGATSRRYQYKVIDALATNFHQPESTLLLLISALVGDAWKEIYDYALNNDFRFLSYGDGSLLWKK